jgi:hypothetical protein
VPWKYSRWSIDRRDAVTPLCARGPPPRGWSLDWPAFFVDFISIEIELLSPGLKLSGRVRISTPERANRSPLFSLSGMARFVIPMPGRSASVAAFRVTTGAFFCGDIRDIRKFQRSADPP